MDPLDPRIPRDLATASAYPLDPSVRGGVEVIQTHLSFVFLTRDRVYKLRKSVDLSFVSFVERAERNADCLREIALNRRLAPDVYLGVAPVLARDGAFRVGPPAETLHAGPGVAEHVVVMRRLPDGRDALHLLEVGGLGDPEIDAAARLVARFHEAHRLGASVFGPEAWLERVAKPVRDNFRLMGSAAAGLDPARVKNVSEAAERALERLAPRFEERRARGRLVHGHGDLHLQHFWYEEGRPEPSVIDCVEFDEGLRRIDAASEVAFLAMDLRYRGRSDLAARFLRRYARETDDFDLFGVVDFFTSYRAAVRAKVAALAAGDDDIAPSQRAAAVESAGRHLALAEDALTERTSGDLVLLCGTVGSGKSSVAEAVADATGGVVISSDRTRKRLAGLGETDRAGAAFRSDVYAEAFSDRVHEALLARASAVIGAGRTAILDATFGRRQRREAARSWAAERGVPVRLIEARCDPGVVRERLERREAAGRDVSDAGPAFLERSLREYEPPAEWPAHQVVSTDEPAWREGIVGKRQRSG